jgi:hypothetical protein
MDFCEAVVTPSRLANMRATFFGVACVLGVVSAMRFGVVVPNIGQYLVAVSDTATVDELQLSIDRCARAAGCHLCARPSIRACVSFGAVESDATTRS